ncbi:MAG: hypothetical protein AAB372_01325 [Patescibacteria group bacterium]
MDGGPSKQTPSEEVVTADALWRKIEVIDMQMDLETGLNGDCFNVWVPIYYVESLGRLDMLRPAPHYEERFRLKNESLIADHIMKMSDPGAVVAFDLLVDEYNANLERVVREEDYETLRDLYRRASLLVRGQEPPQRAHDPEV